MCLSSHRTLIGLLILSCTGLASCGDSGSHPTITTPHRTTTTQSITAAPTGGINPGPPRVRNPRHLITHAQLHSLYRGMPFGTILASIGPPDERGASNAHPCIAYTLVPERKRVILCIPDGRIVRIEITQH